MEGRLRRLRHRHDGALHRPLADEQQRSRPQGRRRIFQRPTRPLGRHRNRPLRAPNNLPITKENISQLKERLENSIRKMNDLKSVSNQVEMTVTPEGLRIDLLESKNGTFFQTGTSSTPAGWSAEPLAAQLGKIPNSISIEGHTDSQPFSSTSGYSNWELSTDRANAARRTTQDAGLRPNQVSQVRGYADQKLRLPERPLDPSNRRISLIVQYLESGAEPKPISHVTLK